MKGIGISPGISIGKAFVIKNKEAAATGIPLTNEAEVIFETKRFDQAITDAVNEIEAIKNTPSFLMKEDIDILDTQIELLTDPQIKTDVIEKIETGKKNANDALIEVMDNLMLLFKNMDDEYLRARSADIKDIGNRILKYLNKSGKVEAYAFEYDTIIIAEDISPSYMITLDTNNITGLVTKTGSKTSHAAIIAKSKRIPAVTGCNIEIDIVKNNDIIVLDGMEGLVYINPE